MKISRAVDALLLNEGIQQYPITFAPSIPYSISLSMQCATSLNPQAQARPLAAGRRSPGGRRGHRTSWQNGFFGSVHGCVSGSACGGAATRAAAAAAAEPPALNEAALARTWTCPVEPLNSRTLSMLQPRGPPPLEASLLLAAAMRRRPHSCLAGRFRMRVPTAANRWAIVFE